MTGKSTTDKASALRRLGCGCLLFAFACFFVGAALAQGPPPALIQAPPVYPGAVNTVPNAVAMGDFNGDGYLDFAVVEYNPSVATDGQVEIFLGNPDGSFTASYIYPIGTLAGQPYVTNHTIGVGHFNGPSQPLGIAVAVNQAAGCTSGGVVLLYGNGDGTFQSPICLPNATGVTSVAVADYNNDQFDDIAVGNASGAAAGTVTVYLNIANTSSGQSGFYNYDSYTAAIAGGGATLYGTIATGTVSGQSGPSLALLASNGLSQYVDVFRNLVVQQSGVTYLTFAPAYEALAAPGSGFSDIALTDISGNGTATLVGFGQSSTMAYSTIGLDVGEQSPVLSAFTTVSGGPLGLALVTGDFDGNGIPDFAYLDGNQNLNISLNSDSTTKSKTGPFGPKGQGVAAGMSTGLNEWVVVDAGIAQELSPLLTSYNAARSVVAYLVDSTTGAAQIAPLYKQASAYATLTDGAQHAFAVADFNGVGVPDVAVLGQDPANFDATVSIFQNAYKTATPPGYATPPTVIDLGTLLGSAGYTGPGSPGYALVAGSFRSFNPDLALVTSEGITLLENQGPSAQSPFNFTLAPNCRGIVLAAANNCYFTTTEYPGLSSATKVRPSIIATDVNGDGYQDVVVAYPETCSVDTRSAIFVFLSNGDGTFQTPTYVASPVVNPVGLVAGKFLGNNVPDLVVINGGEICSGTEVFSGLQTLVGAALIPNNGSAGFGAPQTIFAQTSDVAWPSLSAVAVADMNGDGAPDIVISATDGLHVLLNTPASLGTFTDQGAVPLYGTADFITNAAQIDIADLNKDGYLDVAAAVGGIVYVFPGNGSGGLSTPVQAFASGPDSNQVRAIDVTGDGTPDVVVNNSLGFSVLLNNSTTTSGNPIAQFSTLSLSYGGLVQGTSESLQITLANTGGGSLVLGGIGLANNTGNQFSVTQWQCGTTSQPPYPITIAPTGTCTYTIAFDPNALGIANAQIIFYDNASASNAPTSPSTGAGNFQQSIALTGGGIASQANVSFNISVSPIPVVVGTLNMVYTIALTNSGPSPATNLIFAHQLDPSVMYETSSASQGICSGAQALGALVTCNIGTLPVGSTATISLQVSPTLATTLTNAFSITEAEGNSNAETVPYNVTVVSSLSVTIPTITENIAVSDAPTFPDIPVSETLTVSDQVTVTPLIGVNGVAAVSLSPVALGYGNTSGTQAITLSNVGQGALTLLEPPAISGSAFSPGSILCWDGTTSWPSTLPSGGACTLSVTYNGTAGATGALTFTDSAGLSNALQGAQLSPTSYTQIVALSGSGTNTTAPPPSATVAIPTVMENIAVSDTPAFPDVSVLETITVTDQVRITLSQTITFPVPPPPKAKSGDSFTVAAVGGASGNPVTLSVGFGSVCTLSGATYTMTSDSGYCNVVANQAGGGNYAPAPQVIKTVTAVRAVTRIAPTVTFTGAPTSAVYLSTFNVAATQNSGIIPTIRSTTGSVCTVSGNVVTMTSGTGTCTIKAAWVENDYYLPTSLTQSTNATLLGTSTAITSTATLTPRNLLKVTVYFTVSNGTSTAVKGNVTVTATSGETCTGTVTAGKCLLTFGAAGSKILTATYKGNNDDSTSTSVSYSLLVN